jgi:hypothetical protein
MTTPDKEMERNASGLAPAEPGPRITLSAIGKIAMRHRPFITENFSGESVIATLT